MEVKLVIVGGKRAGTEIPISKPKFLIGRGSECQIQPQSHMVSRRHCAIIVEEGSASIEDLGSTNGTIVNDERIAQRHELQNGDRLKVGNLEFEVQLTVSVAGKRKPKVQSVQEAAARTAAKTDDDLDISGWLDEDELAPAAKKPAAMHDTNAGKVADETVSMPTASTPHAKTSEKGKEEKKAGKIVGQFARSTKPKTDSSRSAAEDMLRQFFHKK